jgi:hypothetical protein
VKDASRRVGHVMTRLELCSRRATAKTSLNLCTKSFGTCALPFHDPWTIYSTRFLMFRHTSGPHPMSSVYRPRCASQLKAIQT